MTNIIKETKILVVDDEKVALMTTCSKLENGGFVPVAASDIHEAAKIIMNEPQAFSAVVADVMMGEADGFLLRKIVHGIDDTMPMLFYTALDPSEDVDFLMRIVSDANSYYLPKTAKTEVLLKRVERMVAARRTERMVEHKRSDERKSLELAANIQKSMLPVRSLMTGRGCYSTWWRPAETVSGDLYEVMPLGESCRMFILGDIRGHGISAAMAMTAVVSFLKQVSSAMEHQIAGPAYVANLLQKFFRSHMADVTYMTALICIHRPLSEVSDGPVGPNELEPGEVRWISCGAPDLVVVDGGKQLDINPEHRGGLPIGLMPDVVYTTDDEVRTKITDTAVCVMYSDGLLDLSRDSEGLDTLTVEKSAEVGSQLATFAREDASLVALPSKFMSACEALGYVNQSDDVTVFTFGEHHVTEGTYEGTISLTAYDASHMADEMSEWCRSQGWSGRVSDHVSAVFKAKITDIREHCLDVQDRLQEVASFRLRMQKGRPALTIWDYVSSDSDDDTSDEQGRSDSEAAAKRRREVRRLCDGVERNHFSGMNETIYHISLAS